MQRTRRLLEQAAARRLLGAAQVEPLWRFLRERSREPARLRLTHALFQLGGLLAIGAMGVFLTLSWKLFSGWPLLAIACAYAAASVALTEFFLNRRHLAIPASIAATFVVALAPLAVYAAQAALGLRAEGEALHAHALRLDARLTLMQLAALGGAALLLWRYRLPFLVVPAAAAGWSLAMDLTPVLAGELDLDGTLRRLVSLGYGLLVLLLARRLEVRGAHDAAGWLYAAGVVAFWSGLTLACADAEGEAVKAAYLVLNLLLIAAGVVLARRVLAVFGGLGVALYVAYLAYAVFRDSVLFPFALMFIGLGVAYLGVLGQRHAPALRTRLPPLLRHWLDVRG